jgi:two-component system response regulator AtoC
MAVPERLDFAELLERTGQLREARNQLAAVKKISRIADSDRARCLLVEGLLSKQMGHLEKAVQAFQQGSRLAERAGSSELLCWCQLRLLGVSADIDGAELEPALLASLRGNTERAAIPSVSIAYQIFLAEYYAKRGNLGASRHHSSLAESVLTTYPNYWLRGLLDLHLSCLSYLEGDYLDSLYAARRALDASDSSGHLLTALIAKADMAAAYLAVGQPARAKACLTSALQKADREEQIFGLLLETLAETQLVSGDLAACSESLRFARDLSAKYSQSRSAWHRAWNLRTEARLLQRSGRWQESLSLIREAGTRERSDCRPFTRVQIECLEALALAKTGRLKDARGVIQRFVQGMLSEPKSHQGCLLGVSAGLSAVTNGDGQSFFRFAHALRIVGAIGETSSAVEIVDQLIELVGKQSQRSNEPVRPESMMPLWRPTNVVSHLDALTSIVSPARLKMEGLEDFVNSLADVTSDASALGEEALRCLASMGWIESGLVTQSSGGKTVASVSFNEARHVSLTNAVYGKSSLEPVVVSLGSKRSRHLTLEVYPTASNEATVGCFGILRLLASFSGASVMESKARRPIGRAEVPVQADDNEGLFRSPAMLALLASAKRVAPLDISVLLTGESGTGKEIVASIIHRASGFPREAFVAFNCATVPRDMIDSQLFGYRCGAFTGAAQGFEGVIGAAHGGTLLLDEVGELPLETQPKLLRFLDSGEIQALGEAMPRKVRVRVIASTNADLDRLVQTGRFREDLYYRLNVVRFRLLPLRERREEVGPLISMFLHRYSLEFGKVNVCLSDAAREHLLLYSWPGNVRQLSHEIRRLVALSMSDSVINVEELDGAIRGHSSGPSRFTVPGSPCITVRIDGRLSETVQQIESAAIANALETTNGRLDLAAKRLGLSRKGLYLKRQRLGIA